MNGFHLAGIVPVAGQPLDFEMPWHDSLMPIAPNYLAVERAVVECAYAGCETIWVICNYDMQPLIRHRLGDYVQDPVWAYRFMEAHQAEHKKPIPIHYVPIHPRDRNKRDCLAWSVLYGAWMANKICSGLSKWLSPHSYYTAFPYGVYHVSTVREHRKDISSDVPFFISHQNKTVIDNEYLGFTFNRDELNKLTSEVREKSTGLYTDETRTERLSLEERFSYRFFSIGQVFDSLKTKGAKIIETDNYWKVDSWEGYTKYISEGSNSFKRPSKALLSYKEWNGIGVEEDR